MWEVLPVAELKKPSHDCEHLAKTLRSLGFTVTTLRDPTLSSFTTALREFCNSITPNTIAFFHYSGHGSYRNQRNEIILSDEGRLDAFVIGEQIAEQLQLLFTVMIFDSCRGTDASTPAFLPFDFASSLVALGCGRGQRAVDGLAQLGGGRISPFMYFLSKGLEEYGREQDIRWISGWVQRELWKSEARQRARFLACLQEFDNDGTQEGSARIAL